MPGKFIGMLTFRSCGTNPDGTTIYCIEWGWDKIPITLPASEDSSEVGWQAYGDTDTIHIPLERLVATMKKVGITASYDEEELARHIGPAPSDPA